MLFVLRICLHVCELCLCLCVFCHVSLRMSVSLFVCVRGCVLCPCFVNGRVVVRVCECACAFAIVSVCISVFAGFAFASVA